MAGLLKSFLSRRDKLRCYTDDCYGTTEDLVNLSGDKSRPEFPTATGHYSTFFMTIILAICAR